MNFHIKEVLIIVYVLKSYNIYIDRIAGLGFSLTVIIYIALFLLLLLALIMASYIKNNIIRYLFGLIFFVSAVFFDAYEKITGDFLTYDAFISLLNARDFAEEALTQFFSTIITSFAIGILLLTGISLKPKCIPPLSNYFFIISPILAVILLTVILFFRGGYAAQGLPSMFAPLSYLNLTIYEVFNNTYGERKEISIERNNKVINHDIVLIIDESISGNYLDINSKYGVATNLNNQYKGINMYNYGYAASIANCSTAINLTLRYGGTRNDYLRMNSTMPSIWKYAIKAGLHTVYIDAQRTGMRTQNGMTKEELRDIERFIQFDGVPVIQRDITAANMLVELLNNGTHDFIIVNKMGAHFPIHDKYPKEFMKYTPALPRGRFLDISDTGSREGFDGSTDDWTQYRNSYKNTLLWNVGEFFSIIFKRANLNNAIIIYTSDHGQDLHERGNPGKNTHCSADPNMEEGLVPLVIIEGSALKTKNWESNLNTNRNRSSHYNIFPTLLTLMSYNSNKIKSIYGNSLNVKTEDDFTFNAKFNARFNSKPIWKKIDLNKIVTPE